MQCFQPLVGRLAIVLTALSWLAVGAASPTAAQTSSPEPEGKTIEIVAFGDSLTQGYGVDPGKAFPEQLQAALRKDGLNATVENAGVSGDTTTGGLSRLDWSVPQSADLVIVELGANDALRGISPEITRQNLDEILKRLTERGQKVVFAGMLAPPNMGEDYARSFNTIYPDLAQQYPVTFYPFFLEGVAAEAGLNQADGMHPNADGVARIVDRMKPVIEEALGETATADGGASD
ncbi:arylesterase [Jiella avicenniae]|uniref:Arylesterase n=1 Tax=Jiella avicenniae TaxID=2907202 RepID=A0A9X1NWL7_9HYPH|nr:arylesterase [Jiella avicenniae]MCE7027105.1 arylesterase [Jiella avicenniae]